VLAPVREHPRLAAAAAAGLGLLMGAFPRTRRIIGPGLIRAALAALAGPDGIPKLTR
jgi:hypothetical protein